jgi:hypothetical protein
MSHNILSIFDALEQSFVQKYKLLSSFYHQYFLFTPGQRWPFGPGRLNLRCKYFISFLEYSFNLDSPWLDNDSGSLANKLGDHD